MEESPKVSVIIPVYNAEKYLREAIESVINQTYQNWELILVNDGSTDRSPEICDEYSRQDVRIQCMNTNGQGACYARNMGLLSAHGDYIFFMDADDMLTDDCLQYLLEIMQSESVDIVCGNRSSFKGSKIYAPCDLHYNDSVNSVVMLNDVLLGKTIGSIWGKLYKREALKNILFAVGLRLGEDINFLTRLLLTHQSLKIFRSSKVIYNYRIIDTSISHNKKDVPAKVKSYIDGMILLYRDFERDIQNLCASAFAKNLCGSVFVYLRAQPFMNKTIDRDIIDVVYKLNPCAEYPQYEKPIKILSDGSSLKLNIYFSYDQIRKKIAQYMNYLEFMVKKHLF